LDVLADHVQELATRCMFFVDDVVLFGETREELNGRSETYTSVRSVWLPHE